MRQNIAFYKHGCSGIEDLTGCNFTDALFQKALLIRNRKLLYFVLVFFFCSFSVINSNSPRLLLDYYNCYFNFKELYIASRNINIKLIGKFNNFKGVFLFLFFCILRLFKKYSKKPWIQIWRTLLSIRKLI